MEGKLKMSGFGYPESPEDSLTTEMAMVTEQLKSSKESAENQLQELSKEVESLEQELEYANMKYEKALKLQSYPKDALDLLKLKLFEKNQENEKLIEENRCLREGIKTATEELKLVKQEYEKDVDNFIAEIQEIADSYRQAASLYTDSGLQAAAESANSSISNIESEIQAIEKQLTSVLEEIRSEAVDAHAPHEMDLSLEKRRVVLKLFKDECTVSQSKLDEIIEKKQTLMSEIELMEKELSIDQDIS